MELTDTETSKKNLTCTMLKFVGVSDIRVVVFFLVGGSVIYPFCCVYGCFGLLYMLIGYFSFPFSFLCLWQALVLQHKGNLMELVDAKLGSELNKEEDIRMTKVALLCINPSPALRPAMSAVVSMLEGQTIVDEVIIDPKYIRQ
jgi:hypothetical protein